MKIKFIKNLLLFSIVFFIQFKSTAQTQNTSSAPLMDIKVFENAEAEKNKNNADGSTSRLINTTEVNKLEQSAPVIINNQIPKVYDPATMDSKPE